MRERRTKLTCYPVTGAASYDVSPAWLRILGPEIQTQKQFTLVGELRVTARLSCHRSFPLQVGDLLLDQNDGRGYELWQIEKRAGRLEYSLLQVRLPFPDDFNSATLQSFWTLRNSLVVTEQPGLRHLYAYPAVGTTLAQAGMMGQYVTGDFDVFTHDLGVNQPLVDGSTSYALLLAVEADGNGIAIGVRAMRSGATSTFDLVRVDRRNGVQVVTVTALGIFSMRLQRQGEMFRAYAAILDIDDQFGSLIPIDYEFPNSPPWEEASSSAGYFSSAGVWVGWGGMTTHTAELSTRFIRNWPLS